MGLRANSLAACCLAEALGTFILIFFGCGAVHAAVLTGAQSGLWQVAIVWGVAVMTAAYVVGGISGAHINPAITVALAAWGRFPWGRVGPYVLCQVLGAFVAAAALFAAFNAYLAEKERQKGVVRGQPGSEITAMCYGEFFPSPGPLAGGDKPYSAADAERHYKLVSEPVAFGMEVLGTLLLALTVFALTDERNAVAPIGRLAPVFIGLTVAILISVLGPLTQCCLNPARDFGPRLFTAVAGWGSAALPGPNGTGWFTVYLIAPTLGAVLGGGLYDRVLRSAVSQPQEPLAHEP
jgi:glycerol uptake facilitator protein